MSIAILVLMYSKGGGLSGIWNKNTSLSLFAAVASSEPWKPLRMTSFPNFPLNEFGFSFAISGCLSPSSYFHRTTGASSLMSSAMGSVGCGILSTLFTSIITIDSAVNMCS